MKLSEFPILSNPSVNAVVPVVDDGANYIYPLGAITSSSGFKVTLSADASSIALPAFEKNKFYRINIGGAQSGDTNIRILFSDFPNSNQFQNRYIFSFQNSSIPSLDEVYGGLSIGAPPPNRHYSYSGTLSTVAILSMSGTVERAYTASDATLAMTLRNGRCNTLLSAVSSDTLAASIVPVSGILRAGFTVSITEV